MPATLHDEQLAEAGVEDQFGRDARIAAAENGRVRTLARGETGQDLLLDGGEARLAAYESLVARDQTRQGLVCRVGRLLDDAHPFSSICSKCVTALCRLKNMRGRPSLSPSGDCCTTFRTSGLSDASHNVIP